ncbi:MAG: hypothetical protein K2I03_05205 [Lachnospiraceae bacterium]|nr:hypothetical protein [Lachnospiraceae bacterium]MDE6232865.1 hypothetical protein [Lachnospiraceae bacterium]MDE6253389.1 hypothetical protein [Lachnospiraceae bacterium]
MEKSLKILSVNLKHNLLPYTAVCILMVILSPLFMGTRNLLQNQTAKVIEVYLSLFGIIMMIPVFSPDMNKDIRDLTYSKKTPVFLLHIIRTLQSVLIFAVLGIIFLFYLKAGNCSFDFGKIFYTLMANSIFLGGMGMLVFSVTDQVVFAYMIPLIYYEANFGAGKDKLGKFYLFTMQTGSINEKHYLIVMGLFMVILSIFARQLIHLKK